MNKIIKHFHNCLLCLFVVFIPVSCVDKGAAKTAEVDSGYTDDFYTKGVQTIPGKIQCEYYDVGGEGVAFHDTDTVNSGSGGLNKGKDYLSTFRIQEAVDISYTKFHDSIDNSRFNFVQPKEGQLYIGWTEPGEWTKYSVDVEEDGTYTIGIMYTANAKGQISLETDQKESTGPMDIFSTYDLVYKNLKR